MTTFLPPANEVVERLCLQSSQSNSVHRGWGPCTGRRPQPSQTYLNLFNWDLNVQGPFDMFKRVHNETRTLSEWAVNN